MQVCFNSSTGGFIMENSLRHGLRFVWVYTLEGELGWLEILNETPIDCMITIKAVKEISDASDPNCEDYRGLMTEAWSNCQRRSLFTPT
jgi:hypothetical protein